MKVETSRCHFYPVGVFYYFINQKCFFLLYCNDLAKLKLDTNLSYLTARNYLARSNFFGRHPIVRMVCWQSTKWRLAVGFFVTKSVCLNRYIWSLCSKFQCVLTKNQFPFLDQSSNNTSNWPKKPSTYSWPKALLTKSSQHLMCTFIFTKCSFSIAMKYICQELARKSSPLCTRF